jgi:hypothetical protein
MLNQHVLVRGAKSGVFVGILVSRLGSEVQLRDCRRIWYWSGAASLSQLAQEGVKNPSQCKFPCLVDQIIVLDAIEIIPCTNAAIQSISEVPVWKF